MDRKQKGLTVVGAVTAFALVAGPLALARKDNPAAPTPRVYDATENVDKSRDIKPTGASLGDEFQLSQALAESGTAAGTADTTCDYVRVLRDSGTATPNLVSLQCTGVISFGPDELTYQGLNSFMPGGASISKFVVTGGTGAYRDARGEVRVTETGQGTATFALDLAPV